MHECDICYNLCVTTSLLNCCKGKRMCVKCKNKYGKKKKCPFCRQNMNRKSTIIIVNKGSHQEKGELLFTVMNYNIIKIW